MTIKIRAEFGADKATGELEVVVPMPNEVLRVSCSYDRPLKPADAQSWDWQEKAHRLIWKFKKGFPQGNAEHTLKVFAYPTPSSALGFFVLDSFVHLNPIVCSYLDFLGCMSLDGNL